MVGKRTSQISGSLTPVRKRIFKNSGAESKDAPLASVPKNTVPDVAKPPNPEGTEVHGSGGNSEVTLVYKSGTAEHLSSRTPQLLFVLTLLRTIQRTTRYWQQFRCKIRFGLKRGKTW